MDIKRAKDEIKKTVLAYTAVTETGVLRIPVSRQRPVLLMGPPGIGKTAVVGQVARELDIGLVAYTMTHHTRQSAIGLPVIEKRSYGKTEFSVTKYTMSEILASVYEQVEYAGVRTGILFLDEINCVSETLMPALLQFLQYKSFGGHKLPEGWVICAAGNPSKYNSSARQLDTVTLDRLKVINIEADFNVWKAYALERGIHPAVISYLTLKSENFFTVLAGPGGRSFVTARAWEDLSDMLLTFEEMCIPVDENLFGQYLQHEDISAEFALFYELFKSYEEKYRFDEIIHNGKPLPELIDSRFDERLCIIEFLIHRLHNLAENWCDEYTLLDSFLNFTNSVEAKLQERPGNIGDIAKELLSIRTKGMDIKKSFGLLSPKEEAAEANLVSLIKSCLSGLIAWSEDDTQDPLYIFRKRAGEKRDLLEREKSSLQDAIINCFSFVEKTFGKSQELVIFLTELIEHEQTSSFIKKYLPTLYDEANSTLDFKTQAELLREKLLGSQ
ncbi:MAG: AAA family ATPase [Clostridiales bacterium]|jgi:DNA polymerase III delta prime subunit|nr:AAA family ATPase [Clostridiales bacterium]